MLIRILFVFTLFKFQKQEKQKIKINCQAKTGADFQHRATRHKKLSFQLPIQGKLKSAEKEITCISTTRITTPPTDLEIFRDCRPEHQILQFISVRSYSNFEMHHRDRRWQGSCHVIRQKRPSEKAHSKSGDREMEEMLPMQKESTESDGDDGVVPCGGRNRYNEKGQKKKKKN